MNELTLLLATGRPAVRTFFASLGELTHLRLIVENISVTLEALTRSQQRLLTASVAVVDAAPDPTIAVMVCEELRKLRPGLPVAALLCCSEPFAVWHFQQLAAVGVHGLLDLQSTQDEALRALLRLAGGGGVMHVQLDREHAALFSEVLAGHWPTLRQEIDTRVLGLICKGLSDREIGQQLSLSPHTVSHRVERLRDAAGVHNRVALAAWAARHGFYQPALD